MDTGHTPFISHNRVNPLKNTATNPPPKGLSPAAVAWWKRLHAEFDLADEAASFLLESALRSFDRMTQAAALVEKHGIVVEDKFGQLKSNPATTVERDSRAAMHSAFKALNLDVLPPQKPGRPAGR
ncbi:P27 family phage terminase small subunit [Rhodanobacter sp. FW102-FHT14D06]|uniref:P27 family phage terminase small subunit n=2 Tax=unclassified Rhodanobacter TaxID=2621553 RepID=A0AB74V0J3_9GAMM